MHHRRGRPQLDGDERAEHDHPHDATAKDAWRVPAPRWPLAERIHDERETDPGEDEARHVEAPGGRLPMLLQEEEAEEEGGEPNGYIDVERPMPREFRDEQATDHRPRGGAEDCRE